MPTEASQVRHSQLFLLLQQETKSEQTATRLKARGFARQELDMAEAKQVQSMALASWR